MSILLFLMGLVAPFQLIGMFFLGWIVFLIRTIPAIKIDLGGLIFGALCLTIFSLGTHAFLSWLVCNMRPTNESDAPRVWKPRWSAAIVGCTLLMFVSGMAATGMAHQIGWLIRSPEPLVSSGMQAAYRSWSVNNLKRFGLGFHSYHHNFKQFPVGATFDRYGNALHGWQTQLLPFLEQQELYNRIDLTRPWNDPKNRDVFKIKISQFQNPGIKNRVDDFEFGLSDYATNALLISGNRRITVSDITDGTSNTILAGEVVSNFKAWGDPTNWRDISLGINTTPDGFGGPWPGGMNFLFADGSVKFIKTSIKPDTLNALATPNGGEPISPDTY